MKKTKRKITEIWSIYWFLREEEEKRLQNEHFLEVGRILQVFQVQNFSGVIWEFFWSPLKLKKTH